MTIGLDARLLARPWVGTCRLTAIGVAVQALRRSYGRFPFTRGCRASEPAHSTREPPSWPPASALAERLPMASPRSAVARTRALAPRQHSTPDLYRDPWTRVHHPEPVDRLLLATWRADQLIAHLAARLEDRSNAFDDRRAGDPDFPAATRTELYALSPCAVQIRHLLAEVTRRAGAYV
jgi:hypothetical protein